MALQKCPDCGSDVSTAAPSCPKCGRPNAKPFLKQNVGCGTVLLAAVVIGIFASMCSQNSDQPTTGSGPHNSAAPAASVQAEKPVNLNDAKALDEQYGISADVYCASNADDYLRSIAKFDFKWDEVGFLEQKFDKYLAHVKSPGVITTVSDKAKLQNGFGAYQHIEIFCDYDTQAKKVLGYRVVDSIP